MNFRTIWNKLALLSLGAVLCFALISCNSQPRQQKFGGATMGTTYSIMYVDDAGLVLNDVRHAVESELKLVNASMSAFDVNSELAQFNLAPIGVSQEISLALYEVLAFAKRVYDLSHGAFNPALMPLINLWGFGPSGAVSEAPADSDIKRALGQARFEYAHLTPPKAGAAPKITKAQGPINIDLAAIAKGYGVDRVSQVLKELGLQNFLVEIGGEIYAAGVKADGSKWRVGINKPEKTAPTEVYMAMELENRAMATSGNYRNFFEAGGKTYTHIIDPRTGYPVDNGILSVTVLADNCMTADALATAIMVLGEEAGMELASEFTNVEVFIINEDSYN